MAASASIVLPERFHYLGRGKQAFAFVSEDGRYVLKLFDERNLRDRWYAFFPGIFTEQKKRWTKWRAMYPESYKIAEQLMPKETGVLVVHMGRSSIRYPTVELIDRASRRWQVDLNGTPFVLQKRGHGTLLERLNGARRDQALLQKLLEQFLELHAKRIGLGIVDRDRDIKNNYAWDGEELLYIDPAQFTRGNESPKQSWSCAGAPLRKWLMREAPAMLPWFDAKISEATR